MPLIAEAISWYQAGYTPLPVKPDGSKAPAVTTWTQLQKQRPSLAEVIELFKIDSDGIGLICGEVSGGLEMLELEARANADNFGVKLEDAFKAHDMLELFTRILQGYAEATPSGGVHFYYRVDGRANRNTKLARRPGPDGPEVLIETRGEGGFTVIAPSAGRTHSTGQGWWTIAGTGPASIPMLTEDERDGLYVVASTLDQMPAQEPPPPSKGGLTDVSGTRPGDEYNAKATWDEILIPRGWTKHKHYGGNLYGWRRPGKQHPGISATTGRNDADRIYVFSTSTDFEPERPYSKFAAYALLNHEGDFTAAAKALRADGYGEPPEPAELTPQQRLAQLLQIVARSEPEMLNIRIAQLQWAVRQIRHSHPPQALEKLRQVAQRAGIPDHDIEEALKLGSDA